MLATAPLHGLFTLMNNYDTITIQQYARYCIRTFTVINLQCISEQRSFTHSPHTTHSSTPPLTPHSQHHHSPLTPQRRQSPLTPPPPLTPQHAAPQLSPHPHPPSPSPSRLTLALTPNPHPHYNTYSYSTLTLTLALGCAPPSPPPLLSQNPTPSLTPVTGQARQCFVPRHHSSGLLE